MSIDVTNTMKVVVATESALKIRAVAVALSRFDINISILPCKADSGVGEQPYGTKEMEAGARGRVEHAMKLQPKGHFYIGIENGLVCQDGRWYDPACVFILDATGGESLAFSAFFPIPEWIVKIVQEEGTELGEVIKELAGGGEKDPMKYLSKGKVMREELLTQALCCALAQILFPNRYDQL